MKLIKIVILSLLLGASLPAFSQSLEQGVASEAEKQFVTVTINNEKYQLPSTKQDVRVDVYSIIGAKVANVDVKSGQGEAFVTLPKGYYIVRANNVSRKIAVK